jgi:DNA topoisomerase IA
VFALRIVQSMAGDIAVAGSAMANHIRNLRGLRTGNHKDVIRRIPPFAYFEVVATAKVAGGQFQMRHAPQDRIVRREIAEDVVKAAEGFEGALAVRVEEKRQGPPKLHDLPSLQKLCGSRFGWSASKTLEVAQGAL